ncbi:MAG: hypothetical protein ACOH5I_23975 [Oligoflexus sp.]
MTQWLSQHRIFILVGLLAMALLCLFPKFLSEQQSLCEQSPQYVDCQSVAEAKDEVQRNMNSAGIAQAVPKEIKAGLRLHYDLTSKGYIDPQAPLGFAGTLMVTIIAPRPRMLIEWRFRDITFQVPEPSSETEKIHTQAIQGALTRYSSEGRMLAPDGDEFWQSLLARIQYTASDAETWQVQEWTSMGRFSAAYQRLDENWQKTLTGELQDKLNLRLEIMCEGRLQELMERMACEETIQFLHQPTPLIVKNHTSLQLKNWEILEPGPWQDLAQRRVRTEPGTDMNEAVHRRQLAQQKLPDILADLNQEEKLEAYLSLKAWIFLHPENLQEILDALGDQPASSFYYRDVIRALTAVGSRASQSALRQLMAQQRNQGDQLRYLVTQFAFVEIPDQESEAILRELAASHKDPKVRHSSKLTLGVVGHRLKQSADPDSQQRYELLENEFMAQLHAARSKQEILSRLAPLGNLGSPQILPYIAAGWQQANDEIKAALIWSLRFVESEEAWHYIQLAVQEGASRIREQALQVLNFRQDLTSDRLNSCMPYLVDESRQQIIAAWLQVLVNLSQKKADDSLQVLQQWLDMRNAKGMLSSTEIEQMIANSMQQIEQNQVH